MKRNHPDRVATPGSQQWNDAQAIAQAILRARDELLEKAKRRQSFGHLPVKTTFGS